MAAYSRRSVLAAQLPPSDRLKLASRICDALSQSSPTTQSDEQARLAQIEAYLAECEQVAELWEGEFNAAADLDRLREEA